MIDPATLTEAELDEVLSNRSPAAALICCKRMATLMVDLTDRDKPLEDTRALHWLANRLTDELERIGDIKP